MPDVVSSHDSATANDAGVAPDVATIEDGSAPIIDAEVTPR